MATHSGSGGVAGDTLLPHLRALYRELLHKEGREPRAEHQPLVCSRASLHCMALALPVGAPSLLTWVTAAAAAGKWAACPPQPGSSQRGPPAPPRSFRPACRLPACLPGSRLAALPSALPPPFSSLPPPLATVGGGSIWLLTPPPPIASTEKKAHWGTPVPSAEKGEKSGGEGKSASQPPALPRS